MSTGAKGSLPRMPVAPPLPKAPPVAQAAARRSWLRIVPAAVAALVLAITVIVVATVTATKGSPNREEKLDWRQQLDPGNSEVLMKLDDEDTKKKMEDEILKAVQRWSMGPRNDNKVGDPDLGSR